MNTRAALRSVRNAIGGGLSPFSHLVWQVKHHSANELKLRPVRLEQLLRREDRNAFGNISSFFFFL